jgi:hypothetical protein
MRKVLFGILCFALGLFVSMPLAFAKGEQPDKITIEGQGLATPIEVTDPETLKGFEHFDTPISSSLGEPYRISFFSKNERGEFSRSPYYVLNYYPNPSGGPGYVFDPYVAGMSRWYHATPEGDALMQRLLKRSGVSSTPSVSTFASNVIGWSPWIVAVLVTLINSIVAFWLLRHRQRGLAQL